MASKKVYRSTKDKILGGVCGGLAEYFNIDSTIIRLLAILLFFAEGVGFFIYIISWIIIPERPYSRTRDDGIDNDDYSYSTNDNKDQKDEIYKDSGNGNKPSVNPKKNEGNQKIFGIILIVLGFIFIIDNWFVFFRWERYWPLILVIFGLFLIFKGVKNNE